MNDNPVILIGGGLAGVTSFYELVSRGRAVVLIEARSDVAQGTSYANGGVLHPSLPDPWNNPGVGRHLLASLFNPTAPIKLHLSQLPKLVGWGVDFLRNASPTRHRAISRANYALADYSTRQTDGLRQLLNLSFDHAAPGTLKLFRSTAEQAAALELAEMLRRHGLVYEVLDRTSLLARESALEQAVDKVEGALYFPDDRVGDAHAFCVALCAKAVALGGTVKTNCHVRRLVVEAGRVVGVEIDGDVMLGDVVLCAGVDAPQLAAPLGVGLPIRPAKGYSITLKDAPLKSTMKSTTRLTHPIVDPLSHIAVTPLGDKIRVLGLVEFIGMDIRLDARRLATLRRFFERLMPDMAAQLDWHSATNWAGLRPMSSDGRPFIGHCGVDGLWANCGHGHLGWTMAVGSARLLADQMTGQQPEIDAAPFAMGQNRLRAFASGNL